MEESTGTTGATGSATIPSFISANHGLEVSFVLRRDTSRGMTRSPRIGNMPGPLLAIAVGKSPRHRVQPLSLCRTLADVPRRMSWSGRTSWDLEDRRTHPACRPGNGVTMPFTSRAIQSRSTSLSFVASLGLMGIIVRNRDTSQGRILPRRVRGWQLGN